MKKKIRLLITVLLPVLYASAILGQEITISGSVKNKNTNEGIPSVSVLAKGTNAGTFTDDKGNFHLTLKRSFPVTLVFSSVGFEEQEQIVSSAQHSMTITLVQTGGLQQEVVVGPSRKHQKRTDAAVSNEIVGAKTIEISPALSIYDETARLKGADATSSSLTFKTISTRGFNGSGSTRVNQLVDGMDNQAPGLNFFVGDFVGLTELDIKSIELLPGASSALYGPGGINGTILISSKNPFIHRGFSFQAKEGVMHVDKSQRSNASPYHQFTFRWAKVFKEKFAFKIGGQYLSAKDWLANDSSNYLRTGNFGKVIPGNRQTDPNYDGVNVYGDETSVDIRPFLDGARQQDPRLDPILSPFLASPLKVSRTGYAEQDVIDPETRNIKLSGALHYKITDNLEAQLMGYWATGSTVYTGNNRYVLKDVKIGQYKLELKHKDWFLRTYTTQEDAGDAYSATVTPIIFNEAWKRSYDPNNPGNSWYPQYVGAFATGAASVFQQAFTAAKMAGQSDAQAMAAAQGAVVNAAPQLHIAGRTFADQGRPAPGSDQFKQIFDMVRKVPIPGGGRFVEKSQLWMTEGQYNFNRIKFADIIVGGNYKKYILDSKGTLFIDTLEAIGITEVGGYAQITKKLLNDYLTLSASGRYDKNEDFKGRFTPRLTALVKLAKDNNLRLSYQTAYRFPSTQQKYIRLNVGEYTLLGGLPWVQDYLKPEKNPVYELINGVPSPSPYVFTELKPESVRSFEIGYKGLIQNKLLIDVYGYWGKYEDFLGRNALFQPSTGKIYSTVVNSDTKVKTHGFGAGLDYLLPSNFSIFFNGYSDVITDVPAGFQSYFNAPKYRLNTGFANSGMGKSKRIGFNVVFHWQDDFMWDGELANGLVKSYSTIDAQVNYKFPKIKSMFKLGGTNITNKYYQTAYGNPKIGAIYYASFAFNVF